MHDGMDDASCQHVQYNSSGSYVNRLEHTDREQYHAAIFFRWLVMWGAIAPDMGCGESLAWFLSAA